MSMGGKTHTGNAFVDFAYDLLEYAIPKYGIPWIPPPGHVRETKKVFKDEFGNAVIMFQIRHAEKLDNKLNQFCIDSSAKDLVEYLHHYCGKTFKGEIPLMELIAYFAFLVDISLQCYQVQALDELYPVVDETFDVFHNYIQSYFTIVGGWHALFQVGEQYLNFIESMDKMEVSKLLFEAEGHQNS